MERIGLREAIAALRQEICASIEDAQGESVRFQVGELTLQFQVEIERGVEGQSGIRFWVVDLGGKASRTNTTTHVVTVPLRPVGADGEPILTGSPSVPAAR